MEKQKLINKINEVLAEEFEVDIEAIADDGDIKETLDLDSLSLVDMVALIESVFGVKLKGQEIISVKTFGSLYDFIYERLEE